PAAARAGIAPAAELAPAPAPAPLPDDPKAWLSKKSSKGLMLFGGAAFATGLVVDGGAGRVISLGGAAVFLVGLWQYLK
ncbi:MAG: hypothetical protein K2X99_12915, partial [Gemmatimonadaceae bacterium]|nr:hypothetical protein [Gemmatimonadaceae bacterium]